MEAVNLAYVEQVVARQGTEREKVIPILQELQAHYRYLPTAALERVCELTEIAPATINSVATFYGQFRHRPAGKYTIRQCHGTACHIKGAVALYDAIRRHLEIADGEDTDPTGTWTIEKVACLGCCTLAPALQIGNVTYGHVTCDGVGAVLADYQRQAEAAAADDGPAHGGIVEGEVRVCLDSCCLANGCDKVHEALRETIEAAQLPVAIKPVACIVMCGQAPMIEIAVPGREPIRYAGVRPDDVPTLLFKHFRSRNPVRRVVNRVTDMLDQWLSEERQDLPARKILPADDHALRTFSDSQVHIATDGYGEREPLDLEEYLAAGGFEALRLAVREREPQELITVIFDSGLRGRGGGGFRTGEKWAMAARTESEHKYVICNGDEGDPGAFMDRMLMESFPYRVLEGMAIAGRAIGAREGIIYVRAEYPYAIERVETAIERATARGFLGKGICGSDIDFTVRVVRGAGAFVCGEETAMLESLEGRAGRPRLRPPYPVEAGLHRRPTLVNNVETFTLVPWIVREGAAAFRAIGTPDSPGTKVFALAGKVERGGLIEVPMGMSLRRIVEEIGGGVPGGEELKAVLVGGPSGGCIPERLCDSPVDYEALHELGAMLGSGGLVVLDSHDCPVEIARYFLEFTQSESCGQCSFCRVGTRRMLDILEGLVEGKGSLADLDLLASLAEQTAGGSLCGLGRSAPNPVLTTLRYFRDEYEAHLDGRCPAGQCKALVAYRVTDRCIGCTLCAQHCPADAIPATPYRQHRIDSLLCTRCDTCRQVCPEHAIVTE